jgi:hypothetical protein
MLPQPDTIKITLEEVNDTNVWKNNFSANYIEDLTLKTGNPLKFQ